MEKGKVTLAEGRTPTPPCCMHLACTNRRLKEQSFWAVTLDRGQNPVRTPTLKLKLNIPIGKTNGDMHIIDCVLLDDDFFGFIVLSENIHPF